MWAHVPCVCAYMWRPEVSIVISQEPSILFLFFFFVRQGLLLEFGTYQLGYANWPPSFRDLPDFVSPAVASQAYTAMPGRFSCLENKHIRS